MKKAILLFPTIALLLSAIILGNSAGPGTTGLERTGASGAAGCGGSTCHGTTMSGSTFPSIQLLSGSTPVTQYVAGGSYTIKLTATNTAALTLPKFGFQLSAVKTSTTTNAGTLAAIGGTHLITVGGINLVEQNPLPLNPTTGIGGGGSTYVVNIPWTAPVAGTGSVTLYGVVNTVNNNGVADAGDNWRAISLVIPELSPGLAPITGTTVVCTGETTTLSCSTSGGTWVSSTPFCATVGATTGIVTGVNAGTATITYAVPSMGYVTTVVTINPSPTSILGVTSTCEGASITLSNSTIGGLWSSSNTSVATIGASTGSVTGIAVGTCTITYSVPTGCKATRQITVNPLPNAGTIAGAPTVCVGTTTTLSNTVSGGTWSSGTPGNATISATIGLVTGVAIGTTIITYTTVNSCGTATATKAMTIQPITACSTLATNYPEQQTNVLKVFPNPTVGRFFIEFISAEKESAEVTITNVLGVVVDVLQVNANSESETNITITPGIYMVTAKTNSNRYSKRIVVQ